MNFIVSSNLFRNKGKHCSRVTKRNAHSPKLDLILPYKKSYKYMYLKSFSRMFIYTKTYQLQQQLQKQFQIAQVYIFFELHHMPCMSTNSLLNTML